MAGGEGSRLRPITTHLPKPLVPVANKPIMEHILELLRRHGCDHVITTLHYLADQIQGHFGDGSEFGIEITHVVEDVPLGTAGAVKQAEIYLKDGTFIIMSGDALTDCDLTKALAFHKQKGGIATLVLARIPNPLEFGIVITDENGRIERFHEKPGWSEVFSDTVNTGMYILEPAILERMVLNENYDWSKDIFPKLLEEDVPMYGYVMEGYWTDVGTLEQYRDAQSHVLQGRTKLTIPGQMVRAGVWVGEDSVIDAEAILHAPVCVGTNCRVKKGAQIGPFTVLGASTLVDEGAIVDRSVIWDRCYIGVNVNITGGTLASRVTVKRETRIGEDVVIGDRCLIDVGCTIRPRVKVWPDKIIERGSTVTMSLVTGSRWRGALFRDLGVAGLSNIEITPEFATRFAMAYGSLLRPGSRVVSSRDSARSSRMLKRSVMASLLSAGCQVIDMHGTPVPVTRHYLRTMNAIGAINVRKFPGNARLSLLEVFDERGCYFPRAQERKLESGFFREEFHRADPDDLGRIEDAVQPVEAYTRDFLRFLPKVDFRRKPRVVIDYGFSSVSPIFPAILAEMGIESISLNNFNDARKAPRRPEVLKEHLANLSHIVASVGCDMGVLVTNEGEGLLVVDNMGQELVGNGLFAALCLLVARTEPGAKIAMSVTSPERLEHLLTKEGVQVIRTKSNTRDLMTTALEEGVSFAGNENGGFIFPRLHAGFDAMFALGSLVQMLQKLDCTLAEVAAELPEFHLAYRQVPCAWETKGTVMRRLSGEVREGARVELMDGIKVYDADSWALVLPDSFEPVFHIFAESPTASASEALVQDFASKIDLMRTGR